MHDKEDEKKKEMAEKNGYKEETEAEDSLDIKSDVDALIVILIYRKSLNRNAATIFEACY